jgi:hypothetical protein
MLTPRLPISLEIPKSPVISNINLIIIGYNQSYI